MLRKHTITLPLLLLFGLLISLSAQAEPVARVLFAHGEVQAQRDGVSTRALNRGDTLHAGDTIQTGRASSVQFRYTDGTVIALRAESDYHIEQHSYDSERSEQNAQSAELLRGGLRAITGAIARERPEAVETRTPVATIGIRGTVYEAFYIPPEGHPALPDVAPGLYLLVLRGRVALTNRAGELILGDGEIAYVPDANTAPALRPDLAGLFGRFAALDYGQSKTFAQQREPDTRPTDSVLAERVGTIVPTPQEPSEPVAGPLAYVVAIDSYATNSNTMIGRFINEPAAFTGNELISAYNGDGDISAFEENGTPFNTGGFTHGDSDIFWGTYPASSGSFNAWDSNGDPITNTANWEVSYIGATQVLANPIDLPTIGTQSYYYYDGAGATISSGQLDVDFGTATIEATLAGTDAVWQTLGPQSMDAFYGTGLELETTDNHPGTLSGRFIGSDANAAIGYYILDDGTSIFTGTGLFVDVIP